MPVFFPLFNTINHASTPNSKLATPCQSGRVALLILPRSVCSWWGMFVCKITWKVCYGLWWIFQEMLTMAQRRDDRFDGDLDPVLYLRIFYFCTHKQIEGAGPWHRNALSLWVLLLCLRNVGERKLFILPCNHSPKFLELTFVSSATVFWFSLRRLKLSYQKT